MNNVIITCNYWWSLEEAIELSNKLSKKHKVYFTQIKGEPDNPKIPDQCWAMTNRYDPNVIKNTNK